VNAAGSIAVRLCDCSGSALDLASASFCATIVRGF
jgi:hypothetical protein